MAKPLNVLFIIADQFRADCLGCNGNKVIKTPNLDRLAASGTTFTSCFNQSAPCGPSRMCIYTGRYMCSTRSPQNCTPLLDAEDNFGFALSREGYRPGLIGYNDYAVDPALLAPGDPRKTSLHYANVLPGFERILYHEYDSEEYFESLRQKGYDEELLNFDAIHSPDLPADGPGDHLEIYYPARYPKEDSECRFLTERAIEYIEAERSEPGGRGWVLSLNYIKPHSPHICCDPYHRLYDPETLPAATRKPQELDPSHPYWQRQWEHGDQPQLQDEKQRRELAAIYYGMISEVDDNIGLLFQALRQTDQWDNTLIIFTSDHGEYLGDHYLLGKGHFYDGALRIPCIVRDPLAEAEGTRGRRLDHFVESIDSAPTILDWLGVDIPDRFQGRSLLGLLRGDPDYVPKPEVFHEFDYRQKALRRPGETDPDEHLLWVVRDRRYKYVQFADPTMAPLLFDLHADPGEVEDLAGKPECAATVARYCQKLLRWRMRHEDQRMTHWAQQYW